MDETNGMNDGLENQARFIAGVRQGIEQADRGEFLEHDEVLRRIDQLLQT